MELNWKPLLERFDKSRLRRSKALVKQGGVRGFQCNDGKLELQVKNGTMPGVHQVSLPAVSWWEPYQERIAVWLSTRPDWLASLLNHVWPEDFLKRLESSYRLRVFPDAQTADSMMANATCTCRELETPCRHVLAAVYYVIEESERNPLQSLELVGIHTGELLDLVHAQSVRRVQPISEPVSGWNRPPSGTGLPVFPLGLWPEESLTWFKEEEKQPKTATPWFKVAPHIDQEKAQKAKQVYRAWK